MGKKINSLRGMRDILPEEQPFWEKLNKIASTTTKSFGYSRIDTPLLEMTDLFERGVGAGTDIVEKEMYTFQTRGKDRVTLRPEFTAGIARAFIENGMARWPKPVKLFSTGSLFRYERPQEGRYREHHQIDVEALGGADPILDAQVILLAHTIITKAGIKDPKLLINSIGCPNCRKPYLKELLKYYQKHKRSICKDCKLRLKKNPLRLLDCKESKCQPILNGAPQLINSLCEECHPHFKALLEYLDELNLEYFIDSTLVRGLDYYTKTVFEFVSSDAQSRESYSLGGGGRYDGLIKLLGGQDMPGIGFGIGMERLVLEMKKMAEEKEKAQKEKTKEKTKGKPVGNHAENIIFLVQLGDLGKKKSLSLYRELQQGNVQVLESFGRGSIKSQLKAADRSGAKLAVIIGQKEALDETVIVRDMEVGSQEIIPQAKLMDYIKKILKKKK